MKKGVLFFIFICLLAYSCQGVNVPGRYLVVFNENPEINTGFFPFLFGFGENITKFPSVNIIFNTFELEDVSKFEMVNTNYYAYIFTFKNKDLKALAELRSDSNIAYARMYEVNLEEKLAERLENISSESEDWQPGYTIPFIMTGEDYANLTGYEKKEETPSQPLQEMQFLQEFLEPGEELPDYFNWMDRHGKNYITPAKTQFGNTCWIYSAIGDVEGTINSFYNRPDMSLNLSESDIYYCKGLVNPNGGHPADALNYIRWNNITSESCFTSLSGNGSGKCSGRSLCNEEMWGLSYDAVVYGGDASVPAYWDGVTERIKKIIMEHGPVISPVYSGSIFGYTGGIIRATNPGMIDHSVLIVGWGEYDGESYWIVKNSWGAGWGVNGTFKIYAESGGMGSPIDEHQYITVLKPSGSVQKNCEDSDSDGYCNWGLGEKPGNCPACSSLKDCDDNNSSIFERCGFNSGLGILNLSIDESKVKIYILKPGTSTYTYRGDSSTGLFKLASGARTIKLTKVGLSDYIFSVNIRAGETLSMEVEMPRDSQYLEGWPLYDYNPGLAVIDNLDRKGKDEIVAGTRYTSSKTSFYVLNLSGEDSYGWPKYSSEEKSSSVADLNNDGLPEIISFLTANENPVIINFKTAESTSEEIVSSESAKNNLRIDGNYLAYFGKLSGDLKYQVYYYNLLSNETARLTNDGLDKSNLVLKDGVIYWTSRDTNPVTSETFYEVFQHNIANNLTKLAIPAGESSKLNFDAYNDLAVWSDYSALTTNYTITLYNLTSGNGIFIYNSNESSVSYIKINERGIFYSLFNQLYFYFYSGVNRNVSADFTSQKSSLALRGDKALWLDSRNGQRSNVFACNLSDMQEIQVTNDNEWRKYLDFYGDTAVYLNISSSFPSLSLDDVFAVDINSKEIRKITPNRAARSEPRIYGNNIVYFDLTKHSALTIRQYYFNGSLAVPPIKIYNLGKTSFGGVNYLKTTPIVVFDLDKDGELEMIFGVNHDDELSRVHAVRRNGEEIPGFPLLVGEKKLWSSPAVGDLNNDGINDIVIAGSPNNSLGTSELYAFSGNGQMMSGWPVNLGAVGGSGFTRLSQSAPTIGDMDGDLNLEIAIGTLAENFSIYRSTGALVYTENFHQNCTPHMHSCFFSRPSMGDLDNDGKLEAVTGTGAGYIYVFNLSSMRAVFGPVEDNDVFLSTPAIGDINDNGLADIVVPAVGPKEFLYGFELNSSGRNLILSAKKLLGVNSQFSQYYNFEPVVLGDFDKDGNINIFAESPFYSMNIFNKKTRINYSSLYWPAEGHDLHNTGNYHYKISSSCGNGLVEYGEECDSLEDSVCPGKCSSCVCTDKPSSLMAYYAFEDNTQDYSGNNLHGSNFGGLFSEGKKGKALMLDGGANKLVIVNDSKKLDYTDSLTLMAWIYPTIIDGNTRGIISKRVGANSQDSYSLFVSSTGQIGASIDGDGNKIYSNFSFSENQWYHIAVVYDSYLSSRAVKMYINGALNAASSESSYSIPNYASNLTIGVLNRGSIYSFSGMIDEVKIFNRALSDVEIASEYGLEDKTPPQFTKINNLTIVLSNSVVSQIEASDPSGVSCFSANDSRFSINCSGYLKNSSATNLGIIYLNISVNDSYANTNTAVIFINVTRMGVSLTPYINNSYANYTALDTTRNIWLNGSSSPVVNITLYLNGSIINSGNSPLSNQTNFTTGYYNFTIFYEGDQNYFSNISYLWLNITSISAADTISPYFVNSLYNMETRNNSAVFQQMNASDETAFGCFALNSSYNIFSVNCSGYFYNSSRLVDGLYYINVTINDSSNNLNSSVFYVNVSSSLDTTAPYFIETPTNTTIVYGNNFITQINASDNVVLSSFIINDSRFTINNSGYFYNSSSLGVGLINLNITINDSSNNKNSTFFWINITKASGLVYAYINGTRNNFTSYNTTLTGYSNLLFNGTRQAGEGTITLRLNGSIINSGSSPLSNTTNANLGYYNFTAYLPATQNYTSSIEWFWINITASPTPACVQSLANTTKTGWVNNTCISNNMNQTRNWTQYDSNNCGYVNVTWFEQQLAGPSYKNTSFSNWNLGICSGNNLNKSRNFTQYDLFGCAPNTTFFEHNLSIADIQNTSWSAWSNITCLSNKMNQTRNLTQYDSENLGCYFNQTIFNYQLVNSWINTSWSAWRNISCTGVQYNQTRNLTQYDSYGCGLNRTFYEYRLAESCSNCVDNDFDGWNSTAGCNSNNIGDCNDNNNQIYPGKAEVCNNIDDNCENGIDENLFQACGSGVCSGSQSCALGVWGSCSSSGIDAGICSVCNSSGSIIYDSSQNGDCNDNNICNGLESCKSIGQCNQGVMLNCSDSISCTEDSCNPLAGCLNTANNTKCLDSFSCTDDSCNILSGCINLENNSNCNIGEICRISSFPAPSGCGIVTSCTGKPDGWPCDDEIYCNGNDYCNGGICTPGVGRDCGAFNLPAINRCNSSFREIASAVTAVCNETARSCEQGSYSFSRACDFACGAECTQNSDVLCPSSGCLGNNYADYPVNGICNLVQCTRESSSCSPALIEDDLRCRAEITAPVEINNGINFISMPVITGNYSIKNLTSEVSSVFRIYSYDNGWKAYYSNKPELSSLYELKPGFGYILLSDSNFNINFIGYTKNQVGGVNKRINVSLNNGWNLVGTSLRTNFSELINASVSFLYEYNGGYNQLNPLNANLDRNKAYWVYVNNSGQWTT